jgi:hypothetical protein
MASLINGFNLDSRDRRWVGVLVGVFSDLKSPILLRDNESVLRPLIRRRPHCDILPDPTGVGRGYPPLVGMCSM